MAVRSVVEQLHEAIAIIHTACGAEHYRVERHEDANAEEQRLLFLIHPQRDRPVAYGTRSYDFPLRLALHCRAGSSDSDNRDSQKVDTCWGLCQSPLPCPISAQRFPPQERRIASTGALTDFLFLHLCVALTHIRALCYHLDALSASGLHSGLADLLQEQPLTVEPCMLPLRPLAIHAKEDEDEDEDEAPLTLMFRVTNTGAHTCLLLEITPNLELRMHPTHSVGEPLSSTPRPTRAFAARTSAAWRANDAPFPLGNTTARIIVPARPAPPAMARTDAYARLLEPEEEPFPPAVAHHTRLPKEKESAAPAPLRLSSAQRPERYIEHCFFEGAERLLLPPGPHSPDHDEAEDSDAPPPEWHPQSLAALGAIMDALIFISDASHTSP
jgi:hypothetical protein